MSTAAARPNLLMTRVFHPAAIAAWAVVCLVLLWYVYQPMKNRADMGEDIYYSYIEGQRILNGVNPYSRIAGSDMRTNQKYATYLPGFYLLSSATQAAGLNEYPEWLAFWRKAFLGFHAATGALIFALAYGREKRLILAIFVSGAWLFNRWCLVVLEIAHTDILGLFFFLLAVALLAQRPRLAWLSFGISLAIKHIGVLALPVLLIAHWRATPKERRMRELVWAAGMTAAVPLLLAIPFLIWDAKRFVKSVLFSVTRTPGVHFQLNGLDIALELNGPAARLPMIGLLAVTWWAFYRRQLSLCTAVLFVMLTFLWFNSIFLRQYVVWGIPFLLLAPISVGGSPASPRKESV